jgi:hypothetical protein
VDGAGANARPAGDLVKRDAKALRREHLLRGPKHPLAIAACVSAQLTVTPVSCQGLRWRGLARLAGHVSISITGAPHRILWITGAAHRLRVGAARHYLSASHEEIMPMTTREDARALVQRMQECFNTRQFDQADALFTPGFFSHPLGTTGFEAVKDAWRTLTTRFPGMRVVAEDILVDGDKVAVRSSVEGTGTPDRDARPAMMEIFRIDNGRLAEMRGITEGPRLS